MIDTLLKEFNRNPQMWSFLILSLLALSYAALKIKNEPNDYLKKSKIINFQGFLLQVPSWWSATVNNTNLLRFERLDTRYDWYAEYWTIQKNELKPKELLINQINQLKIIFDTRENVENFEIKTEQSNLIQIARAEGMSTINGIDRAYFDLFVAEYKGKILFGKSHSSILNGCVEGPYFEEVLQRLKTEA